jgi:hypothetical protein
MVRIYRRVVPYIQKSGTLYTEEWYLIYRRVVPYIQKSGTLYTEEWYLIYRRVVPYIFNKYQAK